MRTRSWVTIFLGHPKEGWGSEKEFPDIGEWFSWYVTFFLYMSVSHLMTRN